MLQELMSNLEVTINYDDFEKDKLVPSMQTVFTYSDKGQSKSLLIKGYMLPGYEAFSIREFIPDQWVLSVRGKMVTYGSYSHLTEVIMLLMQVFTCWHSETSLVYFLTLPKYVEVIKEIVRLRNIDHNMKVNS